MIDHGVARSVELCGEAALGDRHSNTVRESLAERTRGRLDTRGEAVLRMPRRERAPLAERFQVVDGEPVPGEVQQ